MNHSVGNYKKVQAETTDSIKLVVMLYEGAINFLEQAKKKMAENKVADKGILISKVVAIISELQSALNMKKGGDVSQSLDRLYTYMISRLGEANLNNDSSILAEVITHLRNLRGAWNRVAAASQKEKKQTVDVAAKKAPYGGGRLVPGQSAAIEFVG